jgi:hypothetical protein
VKIRVRIRV